MFKAPILLWESYSLCDRRWLFVGKVNDITWNCLQCLQWHWNMIVFHGHTACLPVQVGLCRWFNLPLKTVSLLNDTISVWKLEKITNDIFYFPINWKIILFYPHVFLFCGFAAENTIGIPVMLGCIGSTVGVLLECTWNASLSLSLCLSAVSLSLSWLSCCVCARYCACVSLCPSLSPCPTPSYGNLLSTMTYMAHP